MLRRFWLMATGIAFFFSVPISQASAETLVSDEIPIVPNAQAVRHETQSGCASGQKIVGITEIVRYSSSLKSGDIQSFYKTEMPTRGWVLESSNSFDEGTGILQSWSKVSSKREVGVRIQDDGVSRLVETMNGSSEIGNACGSDVRILEIIEILTVLVFMGIPIYVLIRRRHATKKN